MCFAAPFGRTQGPRSALGTALVPILENPGRDKVLVGIFRKFLTMEFLMQLPFILALLLYPTLSYPVVTRCNEMQARSCRRDTDNVPRKNASCACARSPAAGFPRFLVRQANGSERQSDLAVVPDDANEICWIFSFDIAEVRTEIFVERSLQ